MDYSFSNPYGQFVNIENYNLENKTKNSEKTKIEEKKESTKEKENKSESSNLDIYEYDYDLYFNDENKDFCHIL